MGTAQNKKTSSRSSQLLKMPTYQLKGLSSESTGGGDDKLLCDRWVGRGRRVVTLRLISGDDGSDRLVSARVESSFSESM